MGIRFTDEQVKAAVDEYFEVGSSTAVVEKLGYPSVTTLMKWVKLDKRWNKSERRYRHSTYEVRCACVSAYLDGAESCRSIARRYGTSASQVSRWAKGHLRSGPRALEPVKRRGMPISRRNDHVRPDPTPDPDEVRDEGLREYCDQLKFENDILRAELDLFAKKSPGLSEEDLTNEEKAGLIDSLRRKYRLKRLLARFGMAKSTYEYHHAKDPENDKYAVEKALIRDIFEKGRGTYGYRRIRLMLRREHGLRMSGKTVLGLMRDIGIRPLQRKKGRYSSYRKQDARPEPNILARDFKSSEVCEKMVSDVTEFQVAGRKVYLSPLIDLFNGEVVGHSVATSPTVAFVNEMMDGIKERIPAWVKPVVHTGQGLQYRHRSYRMQLERIGARQSMSRKANCQDNAPAESFFGHLKSEFFYRNSFKTLDEFVRGLNEYIHWYNNGRIRSDLGGMTPVEYREYHQAMG